MNYYNENDPKMAAWLRELIKMGLVADGYVDERSIEDVAPAELSRFTQHHFFAGIGGWPLALRLAGWPDSQPVWTGSCPCQPFSTAGQGKGVADERHLWPTWFWLISKYKPDVIFGEQVNAALGHGWLDLVSSDLEGEGYRIGAVVLPACSVGAPHIRQRLWFVADTDGERLLGGLSGRSNQEWEVLDRHPGRSGATDEFWREADWVYCKDGKWRPVEPGLEPLVNGVSERVGLLRGYGNAIVPQVAATFIKTYMEGI